MELHLQPRIIIQVFKPFSDSPVIISPRPEQAIDGGCIGMIGDHAERKGIANAATPPPLKTNYTSPGPAARLKAPAEIIDTASPTDTVVLTGLVGLCEICLSTV